MTSVAFCDHADVRQWITKKNASVIV